MPSDLRPSTLTAKLSRLWESTSMRALPVAARPDDIHARGLVRSVSKLFRSVPSTPTHDHVDAQEAFAELHACEATRAAPVVPVTPTLPRTASSKGGGSYNRRATGPLNHSRQPSQRDASALHHCASRGAQVLGAHNNTTRAPSASFSFPMSHSPRTASPRTAPHKPSSSPCLMISTTRSPRTSSVLTTPHMVSSSLTFAKQFESLLDPTIVAMLDQHSVLQAEAATRLVRANQPGLSSGDRFLCSLVAGLDTKKTRALMSTPAFLFNTV
ncbi:hypothetical protein FOA52_007781 [Chlamydomonas sp. UWO 241]|nr:hypothetical protein FOA52_007781 [Chlamydomonas sp. UWO 241]